MSIEIIREYDLNGEYVEKIIDCAPVENLIQKLENDFREERYHNDTWARIEALKALDYEQLLRIAVQLMCIAGDYAHGYNFLLTRDGVKLTQDILEFQDLAKAENISQ